MPPRFYLHKTLNSQCLKNCNKTDREELAVNEMCSLVSSNYDSLSIRCVGDWAEEKIYIISQYLGIFATGMHSKWGKVNYIEICCGPGRCIDRKSRCEFDGTSLSILKHESFKYINKALFFDYDSQVVSCLNQRIKNLQVSNAFVNHGDYNESSSICDVIRKEINPKSLTLVVIDPTDCSVPFSLIQDLSYLLPNMDLIINVASGTDFNRNALNVLSDPGKYKN